MSKNGICKICGCESKSIYKHEEFCEKMQNFLKDNDLDKEKIQKEYENLGSVLNFIKKYGSIKYKQDFIYKVFKILNIQYSLSKSSSSKQCQEKRKETSVKNFGYEHNFCKNSPHRKIMESKYFEKTGYKSPLENPEVKQKITETIINKYGSCSKLRMNQGGSRISSLNKWIYKILEKNNINYGCEFVIRHNNKNWIFDVILDNKKLIEVNGDYWHGNPEIYKENDIILKGSSKEILVKQKWAKDKEKMESAKNYGYQILIIWESEINSNEENVIKRILDYANC